MVDVHCYSSKDLYNWNVEGIVLKNDTVPNSMLEKGYKTDILWMTLTDNTGRGLKIEGQQPICVSALNNRPEDFNPELTKNTVTPTISLPAEKLCCVWI